MSEAVKAFIAYIERNSPLRRRQRERPNEEVLAGAREVIERLYEEES